MQKNSDDSGDSDDSDDWWLAALVTLTTSGTISTDSQLILALYWSFWSHKFFFSKNSGKSGILDKILLRKNPRKNLDGQTWLDLFGTFAAYSLNNSKQYDEEFEKTSY